MTFASSTTAVVNFLGASVFTSATSYNCIAEDTAGGNKVMSVTYTSGSSISIAATSSSDTAAYICTGN